MLKGKLTIFIPFNFSAPSVSRWFKLFQCCSFFSPITHLFLLLSLMTSVLGGSSSSPRMKMVFRTLLSTDSHPSHTTLPCDFPMTRTHIITVMPMSHSQTGRPVSASPINYLLNSSWYTSVYHKHIKSHTLKSKYPFLPIPQSLFHSLLFLRKPLTIPRLWNGGPSQLLLIYSQS